MRGHLVRFLKQQPDLEDLVAQLQPAKCCDMSALASKPL